MKNIIVTVLIMSMSMIQCSTPTETTQESTPSAQTNKLSEAQKIERWQRICKNAAENAQIKHSNAGIISSFLVGALGSLIIQGITLILVKYFPPKALGATCATCHMTTEEQPVAPQFFIVPAALAGLISTWYTNKNNNKHAARAEAFLEHLVHAYTNHLEELPDIVATPMQQLIAYYEEYKQLPAHQDYAPIYLSIVTF